DVPGREPGCAVVACVTSALEVGTARLDRPQAPPLAGDPQEGEVLDPPRGLNLAVPGDHAGRVVDRARPRVEDGGAGGLPAGVPVDEPERVPGRRQGRDRLL